MDQIDPAMPEGLEVVFGIVMALVVTAGIVVVVLALLNNRNPGGVGHDPLTRGPDADAGAERRTAAHDRDVQARLAELESLRASGAIDEAEYERVRARILGLP